jgi:hypothetical protein
LYPIVTASSFRTVPPDTYFSSYFSASLFAAVLFPQAVRPAIQIMIFFGVKVTLDGRSEQRSSRIPQGTRRRVVLQTCAPVSCCSWIGGLIPQIVEKVRQREFDRKTCNEALQPYPLYNGLLDHCRLAILTLGVLSF